MKVLYGIAITFFVIALWFAFQRMRNAYLLKRALKNVSKLLKKEIEHQDSATQEECQKIINLSERIHDEIEITKGIQWEDE